MYNRFSQDLNEETIQMMGSYLAIHRELGFLMARLNWVLCADPDGLSTSFGDLKYGEAKLKRLLAPIVLFLTDVLPVDDMKVLKNEGSCEMNECICDGEILIERDHRPVHAHFNDKALILITDKHVPEDIRFGLSFGWKFLFPYVTSDENIHSVLAQLEDCIEQTIPVMFLSRTYRSVANILKNRSRIQHNDVIQWLCFVSQRTRKFFRENQDIFATKSDKGGHTVVIDLVRYEEEIAKMLNNDVYELLNVSPLLSLIEKEKNFMRFLSTNRKTKDCESMQRYWRGFQPNLLALAKFYGLPKVHKNDFCLRPIMSLTGAPSFATGKVFDRMLRSIFPRTETHIRDSFCLKEFLNGVILKPNDILVSFDVVSMFTSIPRSLVREIIMDKCDLFYEYFGMGRMILERFLDFLLNDSTVFTALDGIYLQKQGLPMGSCISPTLARITMDKVVEHLLARVPEITFIKVFVDDTITAIHRDNVAIALSTLNDFNVNIKFTCEMENDQRSINFLNMTLRRDELSILTNWYRKYFASGRLLNFLSSHKRTTVIETAINFIITVRTLSDESFFHSNRPKVIETLRDNSFPETLIITLMNEHYTLMKVRQTPEEKVGKYFVYPHAVCESRRIKRILHKNKGNNVIFAESTKNTKINSVVTRKTITPRRLKGNTVIVSTCFCKRRHKIIATGFDENASMVIDKMKTTFVKCTRNLHAFRKFKIHKGLAYGSQTRTLAKYIQWKYRNALLSTRTGRPEYYFARLMDNIRAKN